MTGKGRKYIVRFAFAVPALAVFPTPAFAQSGEDMDRVQTLVEICQGAGDDIDAAIKSCSELLDMPIANDATFRNGMIVSRGMQYLRLKDYAKARADFEEAIRTNPRSGGGIYGLGLVKIATGNEAEGQAGLDRAAAIAPRIPPFFESLGLTRPPRAAAQ